MGKRLEDQNYYHGIRTREDIENELKKPGDFLVRASQSRKRTDIILNVLGANGLCNIVLSIVGDDAPKYCLHSQKALPNRLEFDSVVDLVNFFRVMPLPGGVKLKRGIHRPAWLIKHMSIQYNEVTDKLGSGNFCDVYKGQYVDNLGQLVTAAIKVCHQDTQSDPQAALETRISMLREAKIMSHYSHPNVIEFFGVACDHPPILLVMEFCPGGSLEDQLRKHSQITVNELILYCFEVSRGMRYLHQQRCIHRDLATRNCLISANGMIKIADFGLSKTISDLHKGGQEISHIPIRWMAPECLSRKPLYSLSSDVWAFGVLIYEVFNKGIAPWSEDRDFKAMGKRIRAFDMPTLPKGTPEIMEKLVTVSIWQAADSRVSFKDILELLTDYIFDHITDFPSPKDLFINKIPGVNRKSLVYGSKKEILADEQVISKFSPGLSKMSKRSKSVERSTAKSKRSNRRKKCSVSTTTEDTQVTKHGLSVSKTQKSSTTTNDSRESKKNN